MKDEEMAEEYAGNISGLDINTTLMVAENKTDAYRLGIYDGFLAGLKAGRPQWHDLEKDPTDLPKEHKLYLCAIKSNGNSICYFNGLHWENKYSMGDFGHCVETVIAWCEIPTFDKE